MGEPTVPRGPIAAMYSSPGPCYGLPGLTGQKVHDPRSVHNRGPAYMFGQKSGKFKDDCSPGPCYLPNTRYTRHGQDGSPHYSLYRRPTDLKMHQTPGPGAYKPEGAGPQAHANHPAYSLGARFKLRNTDSTPAPNSYDLPQMLSNPKQSSKRKAPCFSMTGRSKTGGFHEDLQKTPGPGTYNTIQPDVYKRRLPSNSIASRNPMPGDTTTKPGPGAHSPEKFYNKSKKSAPAFTFGIRHTQYEAPLIVEVTD